MSTINEAVKGQDTESRREGAKERAVEKKSGKIRKNTLDPKEYATQQKKSIEWHDKRTKGRYTPGQVSDVNEVAPPGWGHTKAEKEKTKPDKPKSKIGGTAAAFKRALDDGRFKGLPGSKSKKEKTADMFKLMWSMKKKGDKPHYKPGTDKKYKKYQEEETTMRDNNLFGNAYAGSRMPNVSSKDKGAIKKRAKNLFKKDVKGEHQGVNETLGFKIDSGDHRKAQRAKKIRDRTKTGDEGSEIAKKKVKGPKLYGEGKKWDSYKKAVSIVLGKKKEKKKHEYPAGASGGDAGRRAKERLDQREREKYVSPFKPVEHE